MASEEDWAGAPAEIAPEEAASAISAIGGRRSWLADRIIAPGWYHLSLGLLAGGAIAEAEMHSWVLFAWSVAAYTAGCSALMWVNQRRAGVTMKYFDACTRADFATLRRAWEWPTRFCPSTYESCTRPATSKCTRRPAHRECGPVCR